MVPLGHRSFDPDVLVTAAEFELLTGVKAALVRLWRHRGKVAACGKRGREALYRYGDLDDVELGTRLHVVQRGGPGRKIAA